MTDFHELFMVKMKKMINKKTGGIFLVVYVTYGSLVYTDNKKIVSCLLPRLTASYHICNQGGSKHGRRTFGIFYEDCYARDILRSVCNICLELLAKFYPVPSTAVVGQWIKRWTTDHRVV